MPACAGNLTKNTTTTYIPGNPGVPATSGSPYIPAYCSTYSYNSCSWIPNPDITYKWEWIPYWNGIAAHYAWVPYYQGVKMSGNMGVPLTVYACTPKVSTTCYPAVAAVAGTPGVPATPSQTIISLNVGWNTHSRTIDKLENNGYLKFTVDPANTGLFVGVDTVGKDAQLLYSFPHGMMFDISGVWVFENGALGAQLLSSFTDTTEMHIERRSDGTIRYVAGVVSHISSTLVSTSADLYAYGQIYSGNDRVLCASWETLTATTHLETATLSGAGWFKVAAPSVDGTFLVSLAPTGYGSLAADNTVTSPTGVIVSVSSAGWMGGGASSLLIAPTYADGLADMPALTVFGSELTNFTVGISAFPALMVSGNCFELYVPPKLTSGYGNLPLMASSGVVTDVDLCVGNSSFAALQLLGGEYAYGIGSAYFPTLVSIAVEGEVGDMVIMSQAFMYDTHDQLAELVFVIMSDGILASVYSDSVVKVQEYISGLVASSQFTLLGEYGIDLLSRLRAMSINVQALDGHAALDAVGRVWVVNMDSAASTQYENYGFNSFFVRDGESYGVADDGVYRLSGNTDLLEPITAQINTGSTRFGSSKDKVLPAVYINASSDGKLILKVETENDSAYYYEARSSSTTLDNHRVDTGRGLKSNNWTFTLMNQDGDDFELAHLEFVPLQGTRRI